MILRRREGRPLVIGHRGAARVAPENTLEGLAAAVRAGADIVELDVLASLRLGHPGVVHDDPAPTLDEALAYLAGTGLGIQLDLKAVGLEAAIATTLRRHALEERTIVSSTWARSLRQLRREAPAVGRAISYPRDRAGVSRVPWPGTLVRASAGALRAAMPARAPVLLAWSGAGALSLHHALVSPTVVAGAHARGAAVLAWTVNDGERARRLAALGVDAIVSDDPEAILAALATLERP